MTVLITWKNLCMGSVQNSPNCDGNHCLNQDIVYEAALNQIIALLNPTLAKYV